MLEGSFEDEINSLKLLEDRDIPGLRHIVDLAKLRVRRVFGDDSHYLQELDGVAYFNNVVAPDRVIAVWNQLRQRIINKIIVIQNDAVSRPEVIMKPDREVDSVSPSKIFVVHGHDGEAKTEVARTLEKMDLDAIILHEQPNQGISTVIEKFKRNSDVGAAIILLTPDDDGKAKGEENLKGRARQNVVFEMGYFMGKLGAERVVVLYKHGTDLPSDLAGIVHIEMDQPGHWKYGMAKELRTMGISVDLNKL